jgi:hypothetical protein
VNVVGSGAVDCDALDDDDVATAPLAAGDDEPDEPLPPQDVMTKTAVSISAAVPRALLIIRRTVFR